MKSGNDETRLKSTFITLSKSRFLSAEVSRLISRESQLSQEPQELHNQIIGSLPEETFQCCTLGLFMIFFA